MNICPSQESCVIPSSPTRKFRSAFRTEGLLKAYLNRVLSPYFKFDKLEIYPFMGIGMQVRIITKKGEINRRLVLSHKNRIYEALETKQLSDHLLYDLRVLETDIFCRNIVQPCEAKFTLDFFYFGVCDLCASDLTPRLL